MTTIYKYEFPIEDTVPLYLPRGAKPLCVQLQDGTPCIWMQVVPSNSSVTRNLRIFGTGQPIATDRLSYVGTIQMEQYVWHVYLQDEVRA